MPLAPGTPAPDFLLKTMTPNGLEDRRLSDSFSNGPVVLLFFPAAFSGVCTKEFCDASAGLHGFGALGATVYGISVDSPFAQGAWAKQNAITIPLLSDYRHETTRAYDVELPDLSGLGPAAARAAFVIDKQGIIRYSEQTPTPKDLPDFDAILKAVEGA